MEEGKLEGRWRRENWRGDWLGRGGKTGEEIGQAVRRTNKGEGRTDNGAVSYHIQNGEADPTTCTNCEGLRSLECGQGDLLTMVPVARRLPRTNFRL